MVGCGRGYRPRVTRAGELIAGRYRIVEAIGRGGMGEVYRARDEVLGREVAVKLMSPVPDTVAVSERFLREARAAARICDPHVVVSYDFGTHEGRSYLAMELVSGRTVGDELRRRGPFPAKLAEGIVRQAAAGLAAAHRQGVVHRDIKPGNLLLADDGSVKIADFGIVRFLDEVTTTLTSSGQIVGTSYFLSPERALGKPAEPASDVYALGCVLYQLVTGHPPFVGDEPASILFQHVEREPVPPSDLRPELAGELEALLFWMLAKDPARRPTAAQVAVGAKPPEFGESALDTAETAILPVRRTPSRAVFAGVGAAMALALSAAAGLSLDMRGVDLPATNDLSPNRAPITPSLTVRTTPPPPAPTMVRTVIRTTSIPARPPAPGRSNPATARKVAPTNHSEHPKPGKSEKAKEPKP
jgi:serine/threonine protein kinase